MGYVKNNLLNDEKVQYQAKLHWIIFIGPAFWFLVMVYCIISANSVKADDAISMYATAGAILFFVVLIWGLKALIQYVTSEFAVTNKRVIIKVGLIKRVTLELNLNKVEGISVDQSVLGRIFNYGTIRVTGTGGTGQPFKAIKAPLEFRKKVQEAS